MKILVNSVKSMLLAVLCLFIVSCSDNSADPFEEIASSLEEPNSSPNSGSSSSSNISLSMNYEVTQVTGNSQQIATISFGTSQALSQPLRIEVDYFLRTGGTFFLTIPVKRTFTIAAGSGVRFSEFFEVNSTMFAGRECATSADTRIGISRLIYNGTSIDPSGFTVVSHSNGFADLVLNSPRNSCGNRTGIRFFNEVEGEDDDDDGCVPDQII